MPNLVAQRILRGFGANLYGQAVIILIQLAGVPILLHYWGVELYGEWLILFAIPAYLSITDLGFSISAANDMTARAERGDLAGVVAVFQSLVVFVYATALLALALVSLLVTVLPLDAWLNISQLSDAQSRWVLWFLALAVLVNLAEGVNHAGFRAHGDYALHVAINYNTMLAQYGAVWFLSGLGQGPVAAAAVFAAVRCLTTPAVAILLARRHRTIRFGAKHASLAQLRDLVQPATANVAVPLAQAINIQGMVLVVGAALGPAAVVVFSTLRTLTRFALSMVATISHALEPELASAWGARNIELQRRLYLRGLGVSFWLGLSTACTLIVIGRPLLTFWTNGAIEMHVALFNWLLLSTVITAFWHGSLSLLTAANRHLRAALWFVFSALTSVVLGALFLSVTGQVALAGFALVLMDLLMTVYILKAASRLINIPPYSLLLYSINPLPVLRLARLR